MKFINVTSMLITSVLVASPAYACKCSGGNPNADSTEQAMYMVSLSDVAFEGVPTNYKKIDESYSAVTFKILNCVKGECGKRVTVNILSDESSDCSIAPFFKDVFKRKAPVWISAIKWSREYPKPQSKYPFLVGVCSSIFKESNTTPNQ